MSLRYTWRPRVDDVDDADSSAVNQIAQAVIDAEEELENRYTKDEIDNKFKDLDIDIEIDMKMSDTSENAVQNKVIKKYVDDEILSNAIISSSDGKIIHIYDSANAKIQELKIYGRTEQDGEPSPEYPHALNSVGMSENLLNYTVSSQTISGVTFTVNEDKSITANGTATAHVYFHLGAVPVKSGETYYCSGCPTGGGATTYKLAFQQRSSTGNPTVADWGTGIVITADGSFDDVNVVIDIYPNITVSNLTFYPMITLGTTQKPYEPYGGGSMQVDVIGKNLFDVEKFVELVKTYDKRAEEMVVDGRNCIKFDIYQLYKKDFSEVVTFNKSKTYTWSMDIKFYEKFSSTSTADCYLGMGFLYNDELGVQTNIGNTISGVPLVNRILKNSMYNFEQFGKVSITSASGVPFNGIAFVYNDRGYWLIDLDSIQLEEGSVVTDYEPYTIQSLTLSTPNGLPGIPVENGGTYTDENGQQWICDEIDLARGVYIQRTKKTTVPGYFDVSLVNLNGALYWSWISVGLPYEVGGGLCEVATYDDLNEGYRNNTFYIEFNGDAGNDLTLLGEYFDDFRSDDEKKEEFINNVTNQQMIFILKTPIEIPLSAEEIEAYKSLLTYKPVTHIFNDEGAHMNVGYVADPKNYIDNKFAELQTALLNATT